MVTRVSTVGNYSAILQNLLAAQARQADAGEQVATQKNGKDLKDYARSAEMLTGMRSLSTRLDVYAEQNKMISDKLITQDMALNQVMDAVAENRIEVGVRVSEQDWLMEGLQKISNRITMGLVLAALIIGAALVMRVPTSFTILGYPGLAMILFAAAAVMGFFLVISIMLHDVRERRGEGP